MKRPILYVLIPFIFGIAVSSLLKISLVYAFLLSALFLIYSFISSGRKASHVALYLAIFFFGIFFYGNSTILPGDHISRFVSDDLKQISLKGTIRDDPVVSVTPYNKIKTSFVLNVDAIKEGGSWSSSRGLVDVSVYSQARGGLHFGQKIVAEGNIYKPSGMKNPGLFDYPGYLAIKDIYAVFRVKDERAVEILSDSSRSPIKATAYRIRNWMRSEIDKYLEAPYSGFIKAVMIGDRTDLRYNLNDDFIKTGTVHAIAISGLNVGMIAAMFLGIFGLFRMPGKLNLVLVAGLMVIYAFIAGSSPPIVRAVIIFIVFVAGYLVNRESDMLNSLAFTAFMMLLVNPKELFDPSFQLSFVSIAGMIIFTPIINNILGVDAIKRSQYLDNVKHYLLSAVSVSIAAWIATWPIVAAYFNIISPIALLANLIVVPALFLLTAASFALMFAGLLSPILASAVAVGLSATCKMLFAANHILANLPWAYFRVAAPSGLVMALYYTSILLVGWPVVRQGISPTPEKRLNFHGPRMVEVFIIIALILNIWVWQKASDMSRDSIVITFIDVGQGDSALVELPGGRNILIDAGPGGDEDRFDAARSAIAPYLWNRGITRIDALVITHFHEDHLGGAIFLLNNFKIDRVMDSGAAVNGSEIFDKYLRAVRLKNISREKIGEGDVIEFRGGKISVLNPAKNISLEDNNESSLVLKLEYHDLAVLFCGDASGGALERLTESYGGSLASDVIKIPHHGGNVGNENILKNFLSAVRAKIAIISVAKINKYRTPSQKTISVINLIIPITYETKDNGAITIRVCGAAPYVIKPYLKVS